MFTTKNHLHYKFIIFKGPATRVGLSGCVIGQCGISQHIAHKLLLLGLYTSIFPHMALHGKHTIISLWVYVKSDLITNIINTSLVTYKVLMDF